MVYFANKTRNHAKGFRIQKHLLPANESCVLVLQNCCATDFRKTVIRFVARQVPRRIHTTNILHTARPPQEPIIRETPSRPPEICTSLIPFPLTGKAHFSALNHGGNYGKIEDWRTRDAYCVRNGRLPGPRCLLKRTH